MNQVWGFRAQILGRTPDPDSSWVTLNCSTQTVAMIRGRVETVSNGFQTVQSLDSRQTPNQKSNSWPKFGPQLTVWMEPAISSWSYQ